MRLTERQLNRATLARQLLLERVDLPVADAVRRIVTIQAQDPVGPYLSLWARIAGLRPEAVDAAYAAHEIVRAQLMRITLQTVAADDHPAFQHAMVASLRGSRLNDRRYKESGLTRDDADALLPGFLAHVAEARSAAEIEAWFEARLGRAEPRAWWAFRTFAPIVHAAGGGPWFHGPRTNVVAAPVVPPTGDPAASNQRLLRRYLEGFGPASGHDFAQFSIHRQPAVRAALDALAGELVTYEGPAGRTLHDVPGGLLPDEGTPAPPRLLPMWETSLLAYEDRGRILPEPLRKVVVRRNGDVLATVLVDGSVAGVWRVVDAGVEIGSFGKLPRAAWTGIGAEVRSLLAFLAGRGPGAVYRRHAHWWDSLPLTERRVIGPG